MGRLLHPELFESTPIFGEQMRESLALRAGEVAMGVIAREDPYVSVLIRGKNNPDALEELLGDVFAGQRYDQHKIQPILVDTDPTADTVAVARRYGATHVPIRQEHFNYAAALNKGFQAAEHPYVFTFVDHSKLSNDQTLHVATRWRNSANFAGAYGVALPDANASWTERIGAVGLGVHRILGKSAAQVTEPGMGFMAANASVVSREAWAELGGYSEAYGGGGEDGDFGKRLIKAGAAVWLDPALSVHHTHGLGPINGLRQLLAWRRMGAPNQFDRTKLKSYRPDLR